MTSLHSSEGSKLQRDANEKKDKKGPIANCQLYTRCFQEEVMKVLGPSC